ncbi:hypothetical protein GCM10023237_32580 [Streptomyces coeruleoprunus]
MGDVWRTGLMVGAVLLVAGCGRAEAPRPTPGPTAPVVLDQERISRVLPGPDAVPVEWERSGGVRLEGGPGPDGRLAYGHVGYRAPDLDGVVGFTVRTYAGVPGAVAGLRETEGQYGEATTPVSLGTADEAFSRSGCLGRSELCSATVVARAGSAVVSVNINSDTGVAPDPGILDSVARMMVERVRQVQRGEAPSVRAG